MPRSANGKSIVALNPVRHGLRTVATPVIRGESSGEWEAHRAGIIASLGPVGAFEQSLAERAALLTWRLARVARFETSVVTASQAKAADDYADAKALRLAYTRSALEARAREFGVELPPDPPSHPVDLADEAKFLAADARLLNAFPTIPGETPLDGDDATTILYPVAKVAGVTLKHFALPCLPQDTDIDDFAGWTAALVRQCIEAIAEHVGLNAGELLEAAADDTKREAHSRRCQLKKARAEVAQMEAERQLPETDDLDKLTRYEAHLNRQLMHTLRELEAMQRRREGEAMPLARVDVSGLEGK